jgi:hypothetical protein
MSILDYPNVSSNFTMNGWYVRWSRTCVRHVQMSHRVHEDRSLQYILFGKYFSSKAQACFYPLKLDMLRLHIKLYYYKLLDYNVLTKKMLWYSFSASKSCFGNVWAVSFNVLQFWWQSGIITFFKYREGPHLAQKYICSIF